ncbi:uncharacterized protein TrAtP1_007606 [Trichoderma atroviride]|uniref:uncharacterized protein n=1 Tax=Hypocrea atroviridis TaxID=63577 RepID=UPI0033328B6E|nr:hypothetical protein TrAtP1_007606 [Trichoderma atroviride]
MKKALEERMAKGEILRGTYSNGQSEDERKISEALEKIASGHGTEFITAIALAYVRAKAIRVFPMVGGRKIEHLKDNISGAEHQVIARAGRVPGKREAL